MNYSQAFCEYTLKAGNTVCLTAAGFSMWPAITEGMQAEISPLNATLPEKGSLLLINRENGLMIHRCWGVSFKNGIPLVLTKGDANIAFDPPVPLDLILGQVVLLRDNKNKSKNPNLGRHRLYSRVICASACLAGYWARCCRLVLRLLGRI